MDLEGENVNYSIYLIQEIIHDFLIHSCVIFILFLSLSLW